MNFNFFDNDDNNNNSRNSNGNNNNNNNNRNNDNNGNNNNNNKFRGILIWLAIAFVLVSVFNQFNLTSSSPSGRNVEYSKFLEEVKNGKVNRVVMEGRTLLGTLNDGKQISTYAPPDLWLVSDLLKNNVQFEARPEKEESFLTNLFVSWFPMILLIGVWVYFMQKMQGGRGGIFSFGRSKAKMTPEDQNRVTFKDVAGCDEAKEELVEIVEFLRDPTKFQRLGGRVPR